MTSSVREIDTGAAPDRFARGWHCLGLARDFRDGAPHAVEAFGTKLVVWEDADGVIRVLDAYCRHLGGDLSDGTVKDGNVACPFHDWRWRGDGKCAGIPYAKRVPLRARTRAWQTLEQSGQVFVWHDVEGLPPEPELTPPVVEGFGDPEWSDWVWNSELIEGSHCREIVDNNTDMAHFFYIHHAYPTYFKNIIEGHTATQLLRSKAREDIFGDSKYYDPENLLRSEATYFGPSYMINWLHNDMAEGPDAGGNTIEIVLINCHIPVTQNSFKLQWGVIVKKLPGMDDETARAMAAAFSRNFGEGFLEDVAIWKRKTAIENPLLCEEDGPVYQHRRWYEQFYVDRADVTSEMTDRFEFEVDTSQANLHWEREVAENMRRRTEDAGA
jgi:3-ketosteroid 9alpha-monooxygenase subunit A